MSKPPSSFAPTVDQSRAGCARAEDTLPPSDGAWDSTPAFLRDGYTFIAKRRQRLRTDAFRTRLLFRETICLGGAEASRLFYDETRFQRDAAAAHRPRKTICTDLMTHESIARLANLGAEEWRRSLFEWEARSDAFPLLPELRLLLLRSACRWAGVPLSEGEQRSRAADVAAVIDGAGCIGPRHWRGLLARRRIDRWMTGLVNAARADRLQAPPRSALAAVASHREPDGRPLDPEAAGVELFNFIRPIVAIDRFLVFCAHALHEHPRCRARLATGDLNYGDWFVQEVRRFYPFFSFAVARVRKDFVWRGHRFPEGTRTLLDLYGADHDASVWPEPEVFHPERFEDWNGEHLSFLPQGGAEARPGPLCVDEQAIVSLMKTGAYFLATRMDYEVPAQDLRISLRRMPAQPADGFIVHQVRRHIS